MIDIKSKLQRVDNVISSVIPQVEELIAISEQYREQIAPQDPNVQSSEMKRNFYKKKLRNNNKKIYNLLIQLQAHEQIKAQYLQILNQTEENIDDK